MCSLHRSSFTWPGITRSPVNSTNVGLRVGKGGCGIYQAAVQLNAAGQVHVAVNLALGRTHLQNDGVVDPVAGFVGMERAFGNGGGEGKRRRVELGKLEVKVDSVNVPFCHGRKIEAFSSRVGTSEIEPHVVAHHESHYRKCNILVSTNADA